MQPEQQALPIVLKDESGKMHEFKPENGMYNLTDIHKRLGLPTNKLPAQWRTDASREFSKCANLHIKGGKAGYTLATEPATIAYAMWVNHDFFMLVVNTFIAVRNDALLSHEVSAKLANEHKELLKQNSRILNRLGTWASSAKLNWQKSALLCGIERPNKARESLLAKGYIHKVTRLHYGKLITEYLPTDKGYQFGITEKYLGWSGNQMHFTASGRDWLSRMANQINDHAAGI
ncbi:KilA-N domain-containing protein [Pluralibacter gergoviae]|uniref:KilA-N domain-containing protein n=1 Tax=Pluralibacter gergoviae TaxID=61647 RepID=A0AAW8HXV2_PLUGE|nr:KilA-N domain-containing protein [Pluralibacter gergoviae]MDQ2312456.1 KilA-N domain-containing protein [Pluralibacter gergoviae]